MSAPPVILASISPRRAELLKQVVFRFEIMPSHAEECEHEHFTPREIALLNAYRKARVVAKRFPDRLVIGADTVVSIGNRVFGKPADRGEAAAMLGELSGRLSFICCMEGAPPRPDSWVSTTGITFAKSRGAFISAAI